MPLNQSKMKKDLSDSNIRVMEALECGTSLAEQEFSEESAPPHLATKASQVERSLTDTSFTGINEGRGSGNGDGCFHAIDQLRAQVASDVLTAAVCSGNRSALTSFTSPFELPQAIQKSTKSSSRYLELPLVYCDQTASNRPVQSIERYMEETVLPLYGNTHTNTSITGSQSTAFVAEARQIVAEETNARITGKASLDVVLFAGSGTTAAVELLIDCLGLKHAGNNFETRPIVFVGPYEHHSNLIPWRESGCEIVMVPECQTTKTVDIAALERLLQDSKYDNRLKMGTFTAASNVTGRIYDVDRVAATLHRHGALAFFDYATGAPYLKMDMNPAPSAEYPTPSLVGKDAIFLSPHKMIGGVGTPGVLIVKKHLVNQVKAPSRSGGGTVFYVTNTHHRFLSNRIERYEGGTPNVVGIVRVGLAFLLKRQIEQQYLALRDRYKQQHSKTKQPTQQQSVPATLQSFEMVTHAQAREYLRQHAPNLILLGHSESACDNLPIFSFLIKCGKRFLHFNYVCAILNDVFGIQSRGGCQCAGPYSQRLLGLTETKEDGSEVPNSRNAQIEHALLHFKEKAELLRPGYTRLSLPFKGLCREEVEYVLKALTWAAKHGWALMCNYRCNHRTGEWRHFNRQGKPLGRNERKWLSHYTMGSADRKDHSTETSSKSVHIEVTLNSALVNADHILQAARSDQRSIMQTLKMSDVENGSEIDTDAFESLRWFVYPKECASYLSEGMQEIPGTQCEAIVGALRPLLGLWVSRMEGVECHDGYSNDSQRNSDILLKEEPMADSCAASERKRKPLNTPETVSIKGEKALKVNTFTSNELFPFCDGAHSGEASGDDIAVGFDDGELSDKCAIFDSKLDGWVTIETFLVEWKKSSEGGCITGRAQNMEGVDAVVSFRDGQHSGEAPVNEIENGYDDGELSKMCEIFGKETGMWVDIESFLAARKQSSPATFDSNHKGSSVVTQQVIDSEPRHTVFLDEKTEKKKPSRGDAAWGHGQFQPLGQPSESPDKAMAKTLQPYDIGNGEVPKCTKNKKCRHSKPPAKMMRLITQAMIQWDMIKDGDRLLLGLSGGKDSLSLLHCLLEFQRKLPMKFDIEVCTIDPMTPSFDPSPLIPYVESLGLKYHYIRDDIVARASSSGKDGKTVSSLCAFCARMKRGNLYSCARNNNCNKLVLAQHLDDCAESFMMSVMHNGFLRTMKANYQINARDLAVIRPLVYCRESLMTNFAKSAYLPVINENCPACFEEPKERARIKKLLAREEALYPNFYDNIRRSIIPLMHDDMTAILRCYTEEAVSKSRKVPFNGKGNLVKNQNNGEIKPDQMSPAPEEDGGISSHKQLWLATEDELLMELARRKAECYRLSGAMGRLKDDDNDDPTGQVCSLNGGNGTIPCRELME